MTVASEPDSGVVVDEGKTKRIVAVEGEPDLVFIRSKDDLTAGNGAKHDIIVGKGALANQTTCNVFRLLNASGVPTAFVEQVEGGFRARRCTMLPYEVVIRREAHGSCLKRSPHLRKGHFFSTLVLEFFLKTKGLRWKSHGLPCDDPLMEYDPKRGVINLYHPKDVDLPENPHKSFLELRVSEVFTQEEEEAYIKAMGKIARTTFLILEKAWQILGHRLVDFKVEFGITADGKLVLADVIDNDSWRLLDGAGNYLDKQVYRDGGDLATVEKNYQLVTELSGHFSIPKQCLVIWRGSDKDSLQSVNDALGDMVSDASSAPFGMEVVTCSVHKQPVRALEVLQRLVQEVPDTVVIALIGRSNGAGPTLSANTTVPVITVPASYREFPDDVWSSLRTPSNVPVMTVLEPGNAVLAALQIFAMRNPAIYATLRLKQEERMGAEVVRGIGRGSSA